MYPKPCTHRDSWGSLAPARGRLSCLWQTRHRVSCHRSSQRLGLLHPFTDLLLRFSQGRGFGHSAAGDAGLCPALPKLCPAWPGGAGWCCGAGGDISRCLATRGHPPHAQSILPGTKIADFCFVLCTSISPTVPAHAALSGGPRCPPEPRNPLSSARALHLQHVSRKQLRKLGRGAGSRRQAVTREPSPARAFPASGQRFLAAKAGLSGVAVVCSPGHSDIPSLP